MQIQNKCVFIATFWKNFVYIAANPNMTITVDDKLNS